ncbi:MAG: hypothetical protein KAQ92_02140 [Candidatus Aenigmarchaeota archaeon]|nr:hypothetical protein [Candidatus Aenigmarchaeota archaeon]
MNTKRILIATAIGLLCGLFCLYGTIMKFPGQFSTMILASIVYQRTLMGFVIGIAENIKITPVLRGAVLGAVVGMAMSLSAGEGAVILLAFSIVYGIIIDLVATKFS